MSRAERRAQAQRAKAKVRRQERTRRYPMLDDDYIGKQAAVHHKKCSCWMCGNPRRYSKDRLTLQEKKEEARHAD